MISIILILRSFRLCKLTNKLNYICKYNSNDKIILSIIRKAWCTAILLTTSGKQMNNNCVPCVNSIYFVLISSYIEFPCPLLKWGFQLPKTFFICFNENPLKVRKNAFCFILKVLFVLGIFKFLSWLFG